MTVENILAEPSSRSNQGVIPCLCTPSPTNGPKCQLPIPYNFQDVAGTRFYTSTSLRQGQKANQGQTMRL